MPIVCKNTKQKRQMRHTLVLTCYSISKTSYRLYRQHYLSWLQALCTHPETLLQVVPICVDFSVFFVCVWAIELQYYEELPVESVVIYVVMMVKRCNDWRIEQQKLSLGFFLVFHQYVWCLHICANASWYLVLLSKWRISTFCIPLAILMLRHKCSYEEKQDFTNAYWSAYEWGNKKTAGMTHSSLEHS